MKKCIEINLTKKTIEMIENIRGNLVEFAVALLRAGCGLKFDIVNPSGKLTSVALLRAGCGLKYIYKKDCYEQPKVALLRAGCGLKFARLLVLQDKQMSPCFVQGVD